MPFDVGPPEMPRDDPFKDDPIQDPASQPNSGARLEQAYRKAHGLAANESKGERLPSGSDGSQQPRLLHADGGSLESPRLPPTEQAEPNPLRQVSHPVRRTVAVRTVAPPSQPSGGAWRRNPLRER
jgi:hypothetical protein